MLVKIIQQSGTIVLAEWIDNGMPYRGIMPAEAMEGEYVSEDELDRAIPHGSPWEEIELDATSEKLARNLRMAGIWTVEDLRKKPEIVNGVLLATYGVDYQTLLRKFATK